MKYIIHFPYYLLALLTGGEVVCLRCYNDEIMWSVKYVDAWGVSYARPYTFTMVGHVICHNNGTCSGKSCYVEAWKKP